MSGELLSLENRLLEQLELADHAVAWAAPAIPETDRTRRERDWHFYIRPLAPIERKLVKKDDPNLRVMTVAEVAGWSGSCIRYIVRPVLGCFIPRVYGPDMLAFWRSCCVIGEAPAPQRPPPPPVSEAEMALRFQAITDLAAGRF